MKKKKNTLECKISLFKIRFEEECILPQAHLLTNVLQFAMPLKISLILVSQVSLAFSS